MYDQIWDPEDEKGMIRDYKLGIPVHDIASRYGRTRKAIMVRLQQKREWKGWEYYGFPHS